MTVFNLADAIRAGASAVDKVYLGSTQVWPSGPAETTTSFAVLKGKTSADLTNFVVRMNLADLPHEFWKDVTSDGGNIRVKSGSTQLPYDVVKIDTAARTGTLYFRAPSILAGSDNIFTIKGQTGQTMPAVTDALGRNAVWAGYTAVYDYENNSSTDRTGNGVVMVPNTGNAAVANGVLNIENSWMDIPVNLGTAWSARVAWKLRGAGQRALFRVTGTGFGRYLLDNGNRIGLYTNGWSYPADGSIVGSTWYSTTATGDGTNIRCYGRYGSTVAARASGTTLATLQLGLSDSDLEFYGDMQRVAIHPTTRSDAWVKAEHDSWEDTSNFITVLTGEPYFIQRSVTSTASASSGPITLAAHPNGQAGDQQILALSCHATVGPTIPAGWTLLSDTVTAHSRLKVCTRTLTSGDLAANVTATTAYATRMEMRTYRGGTGFVSLGSGEGLVAPSRSSSGRLIRIAASSKTNATGASSQTITPDPGLRNSSGAVTYTQFDGLVIGDEPVMGSEPARTTTIAGTTNYPQYLDVQLTSAVTPSAWTDVDPALEWNSVDPNLTWNAYPNNS